MAVVLLSSLGIQGLEAQSAMLIQSPKHSGRIHHVADMVSKGAADNALSIYRILRLPSGCRLIQLKAFYGAFGAGATCDIGLYETPANGGAAVNATIFQAAHAPAAATTVPADVLFPAAVAGQPAEYLKRLWERAGLASDPMRMWDIAIKLQVPGANAADFGLGAEYIE